MEKRDIKTRGSITGIVLIVAVVAIALFAGYYWGAKKDGTILETITDISKEFSATSTSETATTSKTSTSAEDKTPAKEVATPKKPIGKLYTDPNNDFTFRYPENYTYEKEVLVPGEMGGYQLRFYETGTDWERNETKSFVLAKRSLDTYQVIINDKLGCIYNRETNLLKIASSFSGKTECDAVPASKNILGTTYFSTIVSEGALLDSKKSFISEEKGIVVSLAMSSGVTNSILASTKDLIIQSVLFK